MHTVWWKFNRVFIWNFKGRILWFLVHFDTWWPSTLMKTPNSRLSLDRTIYVSVLLGNGPNNELNSDIMWRYFNWKCFPRTRCTRSTKSCWLFAKIHCFSGCVISDSTLSMGILRCWDTQGKTSGEPWFHLCVSKLIVMFPSNISKLIFTYLGLHRTSSKSYPNYQSEMWKSSIVWISWWQACENKCNFWREFRNILKYASI